MTLTFQDGTSLPVLGVHGRTMNYEGVFRDSLLFLMDPEEVSLQTVIEAFTPERCKILQLTDKTGQRQETFIHENYTLRVEAGQGSKDYAVSGSVTEIEQTPVVYVRMVQSTLTERTLLQQQELLDALIVASLEGQEVI